jgi:diguanylate cyclase (GGDEF)-like protein
MLARPERDSSVGGLATALQDLSRCRSGPEVLAVLARSACDLAGADLATVALRDGASCHYAAEEGTMTFGPTRRVALAASTSGRAMLQARTLVVADVEGGLEAGALERSIAARSLVVAPIRVADPLGALGVYWSEPHKGGADVAELLEALAESAVVALGNLASRSRLELSLRQRWRELQQAHERMVEAELERAMAVEEARRHRLVDELTGMHNRRGFLVLAEQQLKVLKRSGQLGAVVFMDIDGLALVNDADGHDAGDRLLTGAARALCATVRESDVLGRVGGDEFALLLACEDPGIPELVVGRIEAALADAGVHMTIGVAVCEPEGQATVEDLLATADGAMYRAKALRRGASGGWR